METLDITRELLLILLILVGMGFGVVFYVGHKKKWGIFYDHESNEWVFRRKGTMMYELFGDPEKGVYRTVVVGTAFASIILIIIIIRLVSYIYR